MQSEAELGLKIEPSDSRVALLPVNALPGRTSLQTNRSKAEGFLSDGRKLQTQKGRTFQNAGRLYGGENPLSYEEEGLAVAV